MRFFFKKIGIFILEILYILPVVLIPHISHSIVIFTFSPFWKFIHSTILPPTKNKRQIPLRYIQMSEWAALSLHPSFQTATPYASCHPTRSPYRCTSTYFLLLHDTLLHWGIYKITRTYWFQFLLQPTRSHTYFVYMLLAVHDLLNARVWWNFSPTFVRKYPTSQLIQS